MSSPDSCNPDSFASSPLPGAVAGGFDCVRPGALALPSPLVPNFPFPEGMELSISQEKNLFSVWKESRVAYDSQEGELSFLMPSSVKLKKKKSIGKQSCQAILSAQT